MTPIYHVLIKFEYNIGKYMATRITTAVTRGHNRAELIHNLRAKSFVPKLDKNRKWKILAIIKLKRLGTTLI